jgi:hypothetical protein
MLFKKQEEKVMEIKRDIEEIAEKIKKDDVFASKFSDDPYRAVETVIGFDLPEHIIKEVVDGVNKKLKIKNPGGVFGKIKGILKK